MHLRYDEDFVEAAVTRCASGARPGVPALQITRFHRQRERLYALLDPDERNTAFFKLHLDWFREWGLETLLTERLAEFPLLPGALSILAFRQSRRKNEDGAELYVNEAGVCSGVVAMSPERFEREPALAAFLRHELTHLQDMIDPAFAYVPELPLRGVSISQHRLARERYRLLWDITIDGRLTRANRPTVASREQRWAEFARAFAFWPEAKQQATFLAFWAATAPTHRSLAELVGDPRELRSASGPRPGGLCPLCGFPTFDWSGEIPLTPEIAAAIQAEFPTWTDGQGACARCLEIYQVLGAQLPAVV